MDQTHTTPYYRQRNEVVERISRVLGDALSSLLLNPGQGHWDLVLPLLLNALHGIPQASTGEIANTFVLGKELRLPHFLMSNAPPSDHKAHSEYRQRIVECLEEDHMLLREQIMAISQEDNKELHPPLFAPDW